MRQISKLFFTLAVAVLFSACAPFLVEKKIVGDPDFSDARTFYVVHNPDDTSALDEVIQAELIKMGFTASIGDKSEIPSDIDILVTYEFHWFWDITNYLLQFEIELRDPQTYFPLAKGNSWRASLARKTPDEMAKEILEPIFFPSANTEKTTSKNT
jgi:hypothetical protein